jgi:hypothetical protein
MCSASGSGLAFSELGKGAWAHSGAIATNGQRTTEMMEEKGNGNAFICDLVLQPDCRPEQSPQIR